MDNKKRKVNAKRFLEDYRSGLSDQELMRLHGLSPASLQKLLLVLQQRGLLSAAVARAERSSRLPDAQTDRRSGRHERATRSGQRSGPAPLEESGFHCRQCGASIDGNMLTCPECGHVLPGEERWSHVGTRDRMLPRVPPWVLGCVLALPIGIGLLLVFKHILIPLSSASIQQRTRPHGAVVSERQHLPAAIDQAKAGKRLPVHAETERLVGEGVVSEASPDFTGFMMSDAWHNLSRDEKIKHVVAIRSALEASDLSVQFTFVDSSGGWVARVSARIMELRDKEGFTDVIDPQELSRMSAPVAGDRLDAPLKPVEPTAPQGGIE
jgi:hypothetical protein